MTKALDIVNIVATGNFGVNLDIEKLFLTLPLDEKEYEPETYPALLVKINKPRAHVTLYRNGKFIICGVKSEKDLKDAYKRIKDILVKEEAL